MTFRQSKPVVLELRKKYNIFTSTEDWHDISFSVVATPVVARTRKLRARWVAARRGVEAEVDPEALELLKNVLIGMAR